MTERPVFSPSDSDETLVRTLSFCFQWSAGFAPSQKKKNVRALHIAAAAAGISPLLEISTKSDEKLGRHLSAFHLHVKRTAGADVMLECAFQGSKMFERGGPFTDLYEVTEPREAKRDERLKTAGKLIGFRFDGLAFPLQPETVFYDWLYIQAIYPHREWLRSRLAKFAGFTDIEFNPTRSINCQARSCALFVSLQRRNLLDTAIASPAGFIDLMNRDLSDQSVLRTKSGTAEEPVL